MKPYILAICFCLMTNYMLADQLSKTISFHSIGKSNTTPPQYDGDGDYPGPTYNIGNPSGSGYIFRCYSGLATSGDKYIQLSGADGYEVSLITISYGITDYPNTLPDVIINASKSEYTTNENAWTENASFTQIFSAKGYSSKSFSSSQNKDTFDSLKSWLESGSKVFLELAPPVKTHRLIKGWEHLALR